MDVEEQHRTVLAADRRQFTRLGDEISIRRLAVGDVDDDRRESVRMLLTPRLGNLGCLLERGAHRSAPFPIWIEPDWKFDGFVHHSAGAIVRFLYPVFDAQRLIGQFTDRPKSARSVHRRALVYSYLRCSPAHRRESSRRWSPIWRNGWTDYE